MEYTPPPFFHRGPSPLARLFFFSILSFALIVADARFRYLEPLRSAVAVAIHPLQKLAEAPLSIAARVSGFFVTQARLESENERLIRENLAHSAGLQRMEALVGENAQLRSLLEAQPRLQMKTVTAEILYAGRDPFTRKIVIDKGANAAVQPGQPVVDEAGVVGQVTRAYPFVAEVTLLTDKDQAVPVQNLRSGLRAIAFGGGPSGSLELRYMPVGADVQNGDVLVTSGIDGTYPSGIPVATVSRIERDSSAAFARIICTPIGGVNRHPMLLVLLERREVPDKPEPEPEPAPRKKRKGKGA